MLLNESNSHTKRAEKKRNRKVATIVGERRGGFHTELVNLIFCCNFMLLHLILKLQVLYGEEASVRREMQLPLRSLENHSILPNYPKAGRGRGLQKHPSVFPEMILSAHQGFSSQLFSQLEFFSWCVPGTGRQQRSPDLSQT